MTIDFNAFTPATALAGGALIGLAAALFVLFNGRIAGISGVLGGLLRPKAGDVGWRLAFVMGLMAALVLYQLLVLLPASRWLTVSEYTRLVSLTLHQIDAGTLTLIVAGLLVPSSVPPSFTLPAKVRERRTKPLPSSTRPSVTNGQSLRISLERPFLALGLTAA